MRIREKFITASLLLSAILLSLQAVPLEWRFWGGVGFMVLTYFVSALVLFDNLNKHEWLTILPLPTLFAGSVAFFYTILPSHILSRVGVFVIYAVGMYALYLTCNIYSVARERTIQLVHAAHAVGFFFLMLSSLLFTNVIFSQGMPWYLMAPSLFSVHLVIFFVAYWSVQMKDQVEEGVGWYSVLSALVITQWGLIFALLPISVWYSALFIMSITYLLGSYVRSVLMGRLFAKTYTEYLLAAVLIAVLFVAVFPGK